MNKVRFSSIAGAAELIEELGMDPVIVMAEAGLASKFLHAYSPDDYIEYEQAETLLQTAAEMTDCFYFGALLGSRQDLTILGLLGHVMQQSPTIQAALIELIDHMSMQIPSGANIRLETTGEYSSMVYQVTGGQPFVRQGNELAISEINQFLRILCGFDWLPTEVHFTHKNRSDSAPYKKIFYAPVKFNQDENKIIFHSEILQKGIAHSNPELRSILKSHPEILQADSNKSLTERLEQIITRTLPTGTCSIEKIAGMLSMHRRTLHRRLKSEGTSFTKILEDIRKKIALERLRNSNITIIQLANYLGYSDNSAFTRSFKRWYGSTPQEWRANINS